MITDARHIIFYTIDINVCRNVHIQTGLGHIVEMKDNSIVSDKQIS